MPAQFEIRSDSPDQFHFELHADDGAVLLRGLVGNSKIMVQNEVLHLRRAAVAPELLVDHHPGAHEHFLVVKDVDGSVLARSPAVAATAQLQQLREQVAALAPHAPLVDRTKVHRARSHA
jgi:uncharacterized protein YegP (UPF0339 family)